MKSPPGCLQLLRVLAIVGVLVPLLSPLQPTPAEGSTSRLIYISAPDPVLQALDNLNGTSLGLLWLRYRPNLNDLDILIVAGAPQGSLREPEVLLILDSNSMDYWPIEAPVRGYGTYSPQEEGELIPFGEARKALPTLRIPPKVERRVIAASGVEVVYVFEDGLPAVLAIRGSPTVLIITADLAQWAVSDPEGFARLISSLVEYFQPQRQIAPILVALASVGALAVVTKTLSAKARKMGLLAAPVAIKRISGSSTLEHPVRAILLSLLQDIGSANASELSEALDIPRTTLSYHLSVLEREGLISSEEILGERLYYLPGRRRDALLKAALRSPTRRAILAALSEGPASIRSLALKLGVSTETVKRNVDALESLGLVRTTRVRGKRLVSLVG
ncbi:MAG TPA: ArsR family transcriptional regulator [Candidatus Korarchaeota archaeon]|nr:ArsR family transcriptional regulator [Candidatus Korarchaeota archaeon]